MAAILAITIFVACSKDAAESGISQQVAVDSQLNIASDGSMLIFNTLADYERVVNEPTEQLKKDFLAAVKKMNHTTYAENREQNASASEVDLIEDAYFAQILNKDNMVQIGTYLYLVDMKKEKCFALPVAYKSEINDLLSENTRDTHVEEYSVNQEVLYITQAGELDDARDCGGVSGQDNYSPYIDLGLGYSARSGVRFNRFGVYFRLFGLAQITPLVSGVYTLYMTVAEPHGGWRKRRPCNSGTVGETEAGDKGFVTNGYKEWKFYSGTRTLNGYYFYTTAKVVYNGQTLITEKAGRNINSPY